MKKWLHEVTLDGKLVKLEPLGLIHTKGLTQAVMDGKLWKLWYTSTPTPDTVEAYIQRAVQEYEADVSLPFAVIEKEKGQVVGTTRFMNAVSKHKRLEIGTTWYAKSYQRTGINTECKYLLLGYAFEELGCIAVELRTHWHNHPSRNAITRLGAKQDGVLRNHQIDPDGNLRDTVVFSILNHEWKTVKRALEYKMSKKY